MTETRSCGFLPGSGRPAYTDEADEYTTLATALVRGRSLRVRRSRTPAVVEVPRLCGTSSPLAASAVRAGRAVRVLGRSCRPAATTWGARTTGLVTVVFCLLMIAAHVAGSPGGGAGRPAGRGCSGGTAGRGAAGTRAGAAAVSPAAYPGASVGVPVRPARAATVVANALLIAAGVYAAALLLGRHPRWLLAAALALVLGIELHLSAGFQVTLTSVGGGDWDAVPIDAGRRRAVLVVVGRRLRGEEERNLLVAARPADAAGVLGDPGRDRSGRRARRGRRGAAGGDARRCWPTGG